MNGHNEWWSLLTHLSPFLMAVASAVYRLFGCVEAANSV